MIRCTWFCLVISLIVVICTYTEPASGACAPHCTSGCRIYGKNKCDRSCGPIDRWRYSRIKRKCFPRCGGYCKKCVAPKKCSVCRPNYSIRVRPNGNRFCTRGCHKHCDLFTGCRKQGVGKCDRLCVPTSRFRLRLSDYTCVPRCSGFCTTCAAYNKCLLCRPSHQLYSIPAVGDVCRKPCDANCNPDYDCDTQGPSKCDAACDTSYIFNTVTYFCDPCATGCTICTTNGAGLCDGTCLGGYLPNTGTMQCDVCASDCTTCTVGAGKCDDDASCAAFWDGIDDCLPCDANCNLGDGTGGCSAVGLCDSGLVCNSGFGSTIPGLCAACDPNCADGCETIAAPANGKCLSTCNAGYVWIANSCFACQAPNPENCAACTTAGTCVTCTNTAQSPDGTGWCPA